MCLAHTVEPRYNKPLYITKSSIFFVPIIVNIWKVTSILHNLIITKKILPQVPWVFVIWRSHCTDSSKCLCGPYMIVPSWRVGGSLTWEKGKECSSKLVITGTKSRKLIFWLFKLLFGWKMRGTFKYMFYLFWNDKTVMLDCFLFNQQQLLWLLYDQGHLKR